MSAPDGATVRGAQQPAASLSTVGVPHRGHSGWQPRPIFISSTFSDMQAERDHLFRYVFPE